MTIKRKEEVKEKKPKVKEQRKPRTKIDPNRLTDAVVEGKWTVELGQDFMVSKKVGGKQHQSICTFKEMLNENTVNSWDKTLERWFAFDINEIEKFGIVVKKF
jgi:hypothetical protein